MVLIQPMTLARSGGSLQQPKNCLLYGPLGTALLVPPSWIDYISQDALASNFYPLLVLCLVAVIYEDWACATSTSTVHLTLHACNAAGLVPHFRLAELAVAKCMRALSLAIQHSNIQSMCCETNIAHWWHQ